MSYWLRVGLYALAVLFAADAGFAQVRIKKPLPIDVVADLRGHVDRSGIAFSPDGLWIAHTVETNDMLQSDTRFFTHAGVPLAEGRSRMEARLTNVRTGEDVRLGATGSTTWAPAWSPDGTRVAYYSDEGGSAGLWTWDAAARKATRFPGITVRPFFGSEQPRWSADSQTVLCKILPDGETVASANGLVVRQRDGRSFPKHDARTAGVLVWRSGGEPISKEQTDAATFTNRSLADLAQLDLRTGAVRRIATRAKISWYNYAPGRSTVAYSTLEGFRPNSEQPLYRIEVADVASGQQRTLAEHLAMGYGNELNWSPKGDALAAIVHGDSGKNEIALLYSDGSNVRRLPAPTGPPLRLGPPPLWSADARSLFALAGAGALLRFDTQSGVASIIPTPPGIEVTALVARSDGLTSWATANGKFFWALGLRQNGYQRSLLRVEQATDRVTALPLHSGDIGSSPNVVGSDARGEVAFVAKDQQHPADIWAFDTASRSERQVSHINADLERYQLGEAKVIDFRSATGNNLGATLLLPPGYKAGHPLPLVVWVYGGENGSEAVRRFGLWGDTPVFNMQVLATRGYAVLFPDTPLADGSPVQGLLDSVLPAVDAAVAAGYADPNRLAIMGQSYGAYSALAIISRTSRFKAAIISASSINPDLVASYLEMRPDGSPARIGYLEKGQGRMGGSPWEFRQRYLDNSPIYDFDKINTPVLMAEGADDDALAASDATFVALRRLSKPVEYRLYEADGHVLQQRANIIDFWEQRLSFLGDHLGAGSASGN